MSFNIIFCFVKMKTAAKAVDSFTNDIQIVRVKRETIHKNRETKYECPL